jgi:molybdopterin-guanine dinucleotide biosynthesis protein A
VTRASGILLAGGASRRFGRPKIVEPLDGVLAPDAAEPPLPDGADRIRFARDRVAHQGPLAGTRVGLEKVGRDYAVLIAADMPGVSSSLLSLMIEHAAAAHRDAVVLSDAEGPRPLPAVVRVAPALALARTLLETGERRLRALVEGLEADALPEAVWIEVDAQGTWRLDVDVPGDLSRKTP